MEQPGTKERTHYYQYPRHVNAALSPEKIHFYKNHPEKWLAKYPQYPVEWLKDLSTGKIGYKTIFPWIEKDIRIGGLSLLGQPPVSWNTVVETMKDAVELQLDAMMGDLLNKDPNKVAHHYRSLISSTRLEQMYAQKNLVLHIHHQIEEGSESGKESFSISLLPEYIFHGDLVIVKDFPGGPIIITYMMFLGVLDKLEGQYSFWLYITIMDKSTSKLGLDLLSTTLSIYELLEGAYEMFGNIAVKLFKTLEPICVGVVLQHGEKTTNNHDFLDIVLADLFTTNPEFRGFALPIVTILREVIERHGDRGVPIVLEQYGQEKHHYYPIVSLEGGLVKMYRFGTAHIVSDHLACTRLAGNFKKEYIVAYFAKEGALPNIKPNRHYHPKIQQILRTGIPGSLRECNKTPAEEWEKVIFERTHEFNYYLDPSDLIDDKAITPHLTCVQQLFMKDALDIIGQVKSRSEEHTRLILEMLRRETIDIREFYAEVERLGYIPKEWAVIQLMAKERELKIDARDFSILTFESRMMASCCEKNISLSLLPYFSHQTMSMGGSELMTRIDHLSTLPRSNGKVWIHFHMDLEQWNYTFRPFQQMPFLFSIDQLFGVHHYSYTMKVFTDAVLISAGKFSPPGMDGEFTWWRNHIGGNQGICQKLWTLMTMILIRSVMHDLDRDHILTGSGDNQVLSVCLHDDETITRQIDTVKSSLNEAFKKVGLTLKVAETWSSSDLLCYQRRYYYKGRPSEGGIKQAVRSFAGGSDVNSGVNATIMTAMNGGVGMSLYTCEPLIGPVFAYMEAYTNLMCHPVWSKYLRLSRNQWILLPCLGSDFGFLPFIPLTGFLYSGHQDQLGETLALLKKIWNKHKNLRLIICGIVTFKRGENSPEALLQLLLDPGALNIDKPKSPEALIKNTVQEFLTNNNIVKNFQIKNTMAQMDQDTQAKFIKQLISIRPINVSLIRGIFQNSVYGTSYATLNKFVKITSLVKLTDINRVSSGFGSFSSRIKALDIGNLVYYVKRLTGQLPSTDNFVEECTTRMKSQYLQFIATHGFTRDCVTSLRLFAVSYTYHLFPELVLGPYTPPPMEQLIIIDDQIPEDTSDCLVLTPAYNIPSTVEEMESTRGKYTLYIGSKTDDPVKSIKIVNLDGVESGTAVRMLLKILSWLKQGGADEAIQQCVEQQLAARTPKLIPLLGNLVHGVAGGCMNHRMGSPGISMAALVNSTTMISTHYALSSNTTTMYHRGEEDKMVFFQQLYQYIYAVMRFAFPYKHKIFIRIRTDCCSYPIPTDPFKGPPDFLSSVTPVVMPNDIFDSRIEAIQEEAEHYSRIQLVSGLNQASQEECLGMAIGHLMALSYRSFVLGHEATFDKILESTSPQSTINITNMRKTSTPVLMTALMFQLLLSGQFGSKLTVGEYLKRIKITRGMGSLGRNYQPYKMLIEAFITSGKIEELVKYTGGLWSWSGGESTISIISLIIHGIQKALETWISKESKGYILVELKKSSSNISYVIQFLRHLTGEYKSLFNKIKHLSLIDQIREFNQRTQRLQIILVPDKGLALERGRQSIGHQPNIDTMEVDISHNKLVPLIPIAPDHQPWIFIPVKGKDSNVTKTPIKTRIELIESDIARGNNTGHKIGKWKAVTSSGRTKLLEIIIRCRLPYKSWAFGATLAEGNGSYASELLHLNPLLVIVYNSLIVQDSLPVSMANLHMPPELICPCGVSSRMINSLASTRHFGDLALVETWDNLITVMGSRVLSLDILTWDMESYSSNRQQALLQLIGFIVTYQPRTCIIKLFLEDIVLPTGAHWEEVANLYNNTYLIKPGSSNLYSKEIYFVLSNNGLRTTKKFQLPIYELLHRWDDLLDHEEEKGGGATVLSVLKWENATNFCRSFIMSSTDIIEGKDPLAITLLTNLLSHLLDSLLGIDKFNRSLPRDLQSLKYSKAKVSTLYNDEIVNLIWPILCYIKHINPILEDIPESVAEQRWIERFPEIVKDLSLFETYDRSPHSLNLVAKRLGWTMATIRKTDISEVTLILDFVIRTLQVLKMQGSVDDIYPDEMEGTTELILQVARIKRDQFITPFLELDGGALILGLTKSVHTYLKTNRVFWTIVPSHLNHILNAWPMINTCLNNHLFYITIAPHWFLPLLDNPPAFDHLYLITGAEAGDEVFNGHRVVMSYAYTLSSGPWKACLVAPHQMMEIDFK